MHAYAVSVPLSFQFDDHFQKYHLKAWLAVCKKNNGDRSHPPGGLARPPPGDPGVVGAVLLPPQVTLLCVDAMADLPGLPACS